MEWLNKLHQATKTLWCYNTLQQHWNTFQNIFLWPYILKFNIAEEGRASTGAPPSDSVPCDVEQSGRIKFRPVSPSGRANDVVAHTFKQHMAKLSDIESRIAGNLAMTSMAKKRLHRHLQLGLPCKNLATDGSMESDSRCSFGLCLQSRGDKTRIAPLIAMGSGPVEGASQLNSSTRADLFGLASALQFLQEFTTFDKMDRVKTDHRE